MSNAAEGVVDGKVWTWWTCLKAIALVNILLWATTCLPLARGTSSTILSWQIALSGVYVAVCAFRSWRPRIDLERYCLVDSPWSSVVLGRSVATVAEVCFAVQMALTLGQVGHVAGLPWLEAAARSVVPPLVLAQVFCWYSVITLSHLGHVFEASLWTATLAWVGVCLALAAPHLGGGMFWFAAVGAGLAGGFVAFMVTVDVPMYARRWRQGRGEARPYLSLLAGLTDARRRRIATTQWAVWRPEVAWLTGYFSVAVWISLSFVYLALR
jgi:hypothetical protein